MPDRQRDTVSSYLPPQFFKPGGVAGGVSNGLLDVAMAEIILNQASIRALVGEREAASMAEHVGMGKKGQGAASLYFRTARLTVDRCSGVRCSLTKKLLPVGFMRRVVSARRLPGARRRVVVGWSRARALSA
jgi:hypothetical protein